VSQSPSERTSPAGETSPQYVVAHLRERLAGDARTAELAVDVHIRGSDVFLSGPVSDERQRLMVCQVVAESEPGLRVHDEMVAVAASEPSGREELT
jgi:osmotically-inducible protein OsmY